MQRVTLPEYERTISEICELDWAGLSRVDLIEIAWAYYYFSTQFRENLEIACAQHPDDTNLRQLHQEECDTDNLSPWPGVAAAGERMNHDEFMRRLLKLSPISERRRSELENAGQLYLKRVRTIDTAIRAISIASYEGGGLEKVFKAFLLAPDWDDPLLRAFRWFLMEHIRFDSNPAHGHGALSRHLLPDERVLPLWEAFKQLLIAAVPRLAMAG